MADTQSSERPQRRSRFPLWSKILIGVLLFIVSALVLIRVLLATSAGREFLEAKLEDMIVQGQTVQIDGFEGDLLSSISIERLTVSDEDGVWAEADSIVLEWRPLPLLGRNLAIDAVTAEEIHLTRRPVLIPSEDEEESGSPLKTIDLTELAIGRLALDEGVFPQAVSGTVNGALVWTPETGLIEVNVEPEAEGGDRLVGNVSWDETSPLTGALELNGPAGGLFAGLLQLDADQAVSAKFTASGDTSQLNAALDARLNNESWIRATFAPDDGLHAFEGTLDMLRHPLSAEHADRVGNSIEFFGELDLEEPLETLALFVRSDVLSLSAVDIRTIDDVRSARVSMQVIRPGDLMGDVAISADRISLVGDVAQRGEQFGFDGDVTVETLTAPSARIQRVYGPLSVHYDAGLVTSDEHLRAEGIRIANSDSTIAIRWALIDIDSSLDVETLAADIASVSIQTPGSRVNANGDVLMTNGVQANLDGEVSLNLAEFDLHETGLVRGSWRVRRGDNSGRSQVSLRLNGTRLSDASSALSEWTGERVELRASGWVSDEGAMSLPDISLNTSAVTLTGRASRSVQGVLDVAARLQTAEDYPLASTFSGAAGDFTAQGTPENLSLSAVLTGDELITGDRRIIGPRLALDGVWSGSGLMSQADFSGDMDDAPLQLTSDIALEGANWQLQNVSGSWQTLALTGNVTGEGGDVDSVIGDVRLTGDLPEGLPAQSIDLTARRVRGDLSVSGTVSEINTGPVQGGELALNVSGSLAQADYNFGLTGLLTVAEVTQPTELTLSGRAVSLSEASRNTTGTISLDWGNETIQSNEPFSFAQSAKGAEGQLSLALFGGEFALQLSDEATDRLNITLADVELQSVMQAGGRAPLNGTMDARIHLEEAADTLVGSMTGALRSVAWVERDMTPITFNLTGDLRDEMLSARLSTAEGQALNAQISADIPVITHANTLSLALNEQGNGGFEALLDGRVDNFSSLVLSDEVILLGAIDASLTGSIPFEADSLNGYLNMSEGRFEHAGLGTVLHRIEMYTDITDQAVNLTEFTAFGRTGGSLSGTGSFSLSGSGQSSISVQADQLVIAERREGRAVTSGTFGLELRDEVMLITGDLTLDEGSIDLDRLPTGSGVTTLDVNFGEEEEEEAEPQRRVQLDVSLNAPRRLSVTGQGMDAEMSLTSQITGDVSDIQVNGVARIVRGRFDLLGKRFSFVDSEVRLEGDPMMARLNITAERDADDFTARVLISGTPRRPRVALEAEPTLPEDEILSRVLFGRSPSQLTALETARLAAALAQMGGGGGFDLLGGIEQLAGLDSLDVGQNESGDFTVATGRYLSEDVYLEVSSNAQGSAGVSVEWEPRDNISVTADTVPGEGENLSIEWTRDFD
ncbi:translocation/assembly module TamB domain-containing protein [Ponticaulis sp.]|uniref:translocation/assembly module TamB domain-containing protein n=1 Tax=Ponticaulis sp. TaxID=2020902 RepID=UPI000B65D458|nr:translocation/assembly module TamB domain-containing protein [Ponticaulis sp.]MAI89714.1 hypothetical protein [Ponticaulis sp.]OUY00731.1 MAG: hypothetical protein CBB65_04685 [Hyphomonadaceae bacterium TMED5]|tara:strand:+ start:68818 stop:72957 length:4140 start_codon:yes stop_codon:yes gene_type:complete